MTAVLLAPCGSHGSLARLKSCERVGDALVRLARLAIHIDEIFCTLAHEPVHTTACGSTVVLRGIANGVGRAVGTMDDSTVGSTHHSLCLAVAVPVIGYDVLLVVLEVAHVRTAVHPP